MYIRNTWATRCLCVRMLNRALLTDIPSRCNGYMYIIRSYTYIRLTHMCCKGQYTARFSTICLEEIKFTHVHTIYKLKILSTHTTHTQSYKATECNALACALIVAADLSCCLACAHGQSIERSCVTYIHTYWPASVYACVWCVRLCVCVCVFECVCAFDC